MRSDTELLRPLTSSTVDLARTATPTSYPKAGEILPIQVLFERLKTLVGSQFKDSGFDQERNRGAALHRLVCQVLGYASYQDDGQFPMYGINC